MLWLGFWLVILCIGIVFGLKGIVFMLRSRWMVRLVIFMFLIWVLMVKIIWFVSFMGNLIRKC